MNGAMLQTQKEEKKTMQMSKPNTNLQNMIPNNGLKKYFGE